MPAGSREKIDAPNVASPCMNPTPLNRFPPLAQFLHWGMFVLLIVQWIDGKVMDGLPKPGALRPFAFDMHETIGVLVLLLVFVRLSWKIAHPVAAGPGPAWQQRAAAFTQWLLYAIMIALPVTGYLTFSAQGHPTTFFGLDLPAALARDRATARSLKNVHELLSDALLIVVALHAAAALWHHFVARDDTLRRMLPQRSASG